MKGCCQLHPLIKYCLIGFHSVCPGPTETVGLHHCHCHGTGRTALHTPLPLPRHWPYCNCWHTTAIATALALLQLVAYTTVLCKGPLPPHWPYCHCWTTPLCRAIATALALLQLLTYTTASRAIATVLARL